MKVELKDQRRDSNAQQYLKLKPCLVSRDKITYRQIFQLQLTDCVVRFDVF